jgi:hypothetical protein
LIGLRGGDGTSTPAGLDRCHGAGDEDELRSPDRVLVYVSGDVHAPRIEGFWSLVKSTPISAEPCPGRWRCRQGSGTPSAVPLSATNHERRGDHSDDGSCRELPSGDDRGGDQDEHPQDARDDGSDRDADP